VRELELVAKIARDIAKKATPEREVTSRREVEKAEASNECPNELGRERTSIVLQFHSRLL